MAARKTVYMVTNEVDKSATLVRAGSKAQAVKHATRTIFKARVASISDVVQYMQQTQNAAIEDAGEEEKE